MTRAAIYARYSSQAQREASIEDQMRLCVERAARDGYEVVQNYADMAISGASMHRSGLQSLLDDAARGTFDILIAEALDRLSRDQADVATLYKRLSFHGVRIVTLAKGGDQRTACRAQGHDEPAVPEGSRRQNPARPARAG